MPTKITLVAALSDNNCIGKNNAIPWHVPEDFEFFKNYTMGKPVIMGRKTWDSLPRKPLPGRPNYIISQQKNLNCTSANHFYSLKEAIEKLSDHEEIIIMGGAQIYTQALAIATDLRLTRIHITVNGDTFFPDIAPDQWKKIASSNHISSKNQIKYDFEHFIRENT